MFKEVGFCNKVVALVVVLCLIIPVLAACDDDDDEDTQPPATTTQPTATTVQTTATATTDQSPATTVPTPVNTTQPNTDTSEANFELVQHPYREGESFDYFYEISVNTYATEQDGSIPRITELEKVEEATVMLRLSVLSVEEGKVSKRIEFLDARYRELSREDLQNRKSEDIPLQPIHSLVPGFPENFSYTYDSGEAMAAFQLSGYYKEYIDHKIIQFISSHLVDIHTFGSNIEPLTQTMALMLPPDYVESKGLEAFPGQVRLDPPLDIPFGGGDFHINDALQWYQRVVYLNGLKQAYFKVQSFGNYNTKPGEKLSTNYLYSYYVPLEGEAKGLVSSGELQELIYVEAENEPITAHLRQLSMTMQTENNRSVLDIYNHN